MPPFVEMITTSRAVHEKWKELSRTLSEPPAGLWAVIAWETPGESDQVTTLLTWETPAARGEWAMERMMPLMETGELGGDDHPEQLKPVDVFINDHPA